MERQFYLSLASRGLRMPIGTDLVLHEHDDPEAIMRDGRRLGQVMETAANRYRTPLAVPLMDLRLEKADLLRTLGVAESEVDTFHFSAAPGEEALARVEAAMDAPFSQRNQANIDSIAYIARESDLAPVGMAIGPFSLSTKLMADPITPIAMAGTGLTAEEDSGVLMAERCLALAEMAVSRSIHAQVRAGAKAVIICEPAANIVYLSPKQIEAGSDIFERFVMGPDLRLRQRLADMGVDLIFHDCGELTAQMVTEFGNRLDPAILSFGSSRKLWEDAAIVPKHVVLYGNLPTKSFYSDSAMPVERVKELTNELTAKMRATGHPHILGSECDVLHVPEAAATIRRKVEAMLDSTSLR
jgi:uroporphyrinogen-III decarboxylase